MELFTMGIDLGKTTFHLVGMSQRGEVVLRKRFSRAQLLSGAVLVLLAELKQELEQLAEKIDLLNRLVSTIGRVFLGNHSQPGGEIE